MYRNEIADIRDNIDNSVLNYVLTYKTFPPQDDDDDSDEELNKSELPESEIERDIIDVYAGINPERTYRPGYLKYPDSEPEEYEDEYYAPAKTVDRRDPEAARVPDRATMILFEARKKANGKKRANANDDVLPRFNGSTVPRNPPPNKNLKFKNRPHDFLYFEPHPDHNHIYVSRKVRPVQRLILESKSENHNVKPDQPSVRRKMKKEQEIVDKSIRTIIEFELRRKSATTKDDASNDDVTDDEADKINVIVLAEPVWLAEEVKRQTKLFKDKQAAKLSDEQVAESADAQATKLSDEQVAMSSNEQAVHKPDEQTTKPSEEQIPKPSDEQITKPSDEQITKPSDEQETNSEPDKEQVDRRISRKGKEIFKIRFPGAPRLPERNNIIERILNEAYPDYDRKLVTELYDDPTLPEIIQKKIEEEEMERQRKEEERLQKQRQKEERRLQKKKERAQRAEERRLEEKRLAVIAYKEEVARLEAAIAEKIRQAKEAKRIRAREERRAAKIKLLLSGKR
ncbi:hypothetical protein BJV82DRAFT_393615 [Fennellomyces sp. T-0311]|nr:hypothetical protein BJV82DRAFT_393615 [Fennellomyces sp. T-0311]